MSAGVRRCCLGHEKCCEGVLCVRHPWAGFLGGAGLWNDSSKKGILEGGAV